MQHLPDWSLSNTRTPSQESAGVTAAQCYANQPFINRILNYQTETGNDTHSYLHTCNQSVYQTADASCLSIAATVAALPE